MDKTQMEFPGDLHLFCHVVDNFGDIGVCWRLARQFVHEHGIQVVLWVDDLASLKKISSPVNPSLDWQKVSGVVVRRWAADFAPVSPDETGDIVIEAFGCRLPDNYIQAMAKKAIAPAWINLEYLSAEDWVEGCHRLASPHPSLPLTKYFFFPGFTSKTGGLALEQDLLERRQTFQQSEHAATDFLLSLGVTGRPHERKLSLFCYPQAPVASLFDALTTDTGKPTLCLVPEGVAANAVERFLGQPGRAGLSAERGALRIHVLPFIDQDDYDRLLWSCDLNFVRGEDSFVRAQWAARPFIWHIYPQEENAHMTKLDAFLQQYEALLPAEQAIKVRKFWHAWNTGEQDKSHLKNQWHDFQSILPELSHIGPAWASRLFKNGDLVSSLVRFSQEIR